MKHTSIISTLTAAVLSLSSPLFAQENLVPKPVTVTIDNAAAPLIIKEDISVSADSKYAKNAFLYLQSVAGKALKVIEEKDAAKATIQFKLKKELRPEAYTLEVSNKGIVIHASSEAGFFYASVSLLKMMPDDVWSEKGLSEKTLTLKACKIHDYPRFAWRGMMLDCSRQFFEKEYVMKFIDRMAQHKLNVFHWHLTDDEGWRIEIKKYPKLTSIGSKRSPGTAIPFSMIPAPEGPKDKVQEGFYTQEDIKEIVAYAQARNVMIIPEIDVPGHAKAAVVCYPELLQDPNDKSVYSSVQGTKNNTVDAGLETTYTFLDDVFEEVASLFPAPYIHVGGDEIPHGAWEKSPAVKALMKKENLKSLAEVRTYFFRRLEKSLQKHGKKLAGWEEVMHGGGLSRKDSMIFSWQSTAAGVKAAKSQIPAVMAPAQKVYYDLKYENAPGEPGLTWAGTTTTKDSYHYDPMPKGLTADQQSYIKGVHGCLWAETLVTPETADYMAWPRMFALAEIGWTPQDQRDWKDFSRRAFKHQLPKLAQQGIAFRIPKVSATLSIDNMMTINAPYKGAVIRYTIDGKVTTNSPVYSKPFTFKPGANFSAALQIGDRIGKITSSYSLPPIGKWSPQNTPKGVEVVDFDVSKIVTQAGDYQFIFNYNKGAHALEVSKVELQQGGKTIAEDAHKGTMGSKHSNNVYKCSIPKGFKFSSGPVTLKVTMKGDGGSDSNGVISYSYEPPRPTRKVTSNITHHANYVVANACDYKESTWFWSNRNFKKDDQITVIYEEAQVGKTVFVETGKPDGGDQIVAGKLAVTYDGNTWKDVADIAYGKAEYAIPAGKKVKGIRLRVTESQDTWVIVRELNIK